MKSETVFIPEFGSYYITFGGRAQTIFVPRPSAKLRAKKHAAKIAAALERAPEAPLGWELTGVRERRETVDPGFRAKRTWLLCDVGQGWDAEYFPRGAENAPPALQPHEVEALKAS